MKATMKMTREELEEQRYLKRAAHPVKSRRAYSRKNVRFDHDYS